MKLLSRSIFLIIFIFLFFADVCLCSNGNNNDFVRRSVRRTFPVDRLVDNRDNFPTPYCKYQQKKKLCEENGQKFREKKNQGESEQNPSSFLRPNAITELINKNNNKQARDDKSDE